MSESKLGDERKALSQEFAHEGSALEKRRKALEEEFFRKQNERLAAELRMKRLTEEAKSDMSRLSGITDDAVLDKLVEMGIGADTLAAITLVPLVEVAWADDHMDDPEREAILAGAAENGIEAGSPAYALLEDWLVNRPPPRLLGTWRDYVGALCDEMLPEQRQHLKRDVLAKARAVAEAAGGFLGMKKVSREESQIYEILETAFKV